MFCQYLSHKRSNHQVLAELETSFIKAIQPKGSVCIRTCHRLEFYANAAFELPAPPEALGAPWIQVSGLQPVLKRLACLAAGIDSRILGEQFVAYQCSRPFLKSQDPHLPFGLIAAAFDIACRMKKSFRFDTSFSYDDAAFALLETSRYHPKPSHLVIFGAGLLGQAIVEHARAREYETVQVITRNPVGLSRMLGQVNSLLSIQASTVGDAALPLAYDCVIATDNRSPAFAASVDRMLKARLAGNVVDLSAVPVISEALKDPPGVYHMHSPHMQFLINEANAHLEHLVAPLTAAISGLVSDICTSHGGDQCS